MPAISTNTAANSAVRYLNINSMQETSALSKLSSGSRITSASDDAAGLAISTRISSDITTLQQAATNAAQATSILQTADGGAFDIRVVIVTDMERARGVDALLGEIGPEQRLALAAAVIAGCVEEIPGQSGAAGPQQLRELVGIPIGVGDESGAKTAALHVDILLEHFRIDAAQLELGVEFDPCEILQRIAVQAEQPERKVLVDVGDAHFGGGAALQRQLARACLCLDSMLNETDGHARKFFSNARKLKNPFKYAIWRRAGTQQKCIENIE